MFAGSGVGEFMSQRREVLGAAASYKLGKHQWTLGDFFKYASWEVLPDKTEIFSCKGEPLVWFYPLKVESFRDDSGPKMRVVQEYKLLYIEKDN